MSNEIANSSSIDLVNERRRTKAQKLLDAKMAELSKEHQDWDEKPVPNLSTIELNHPSWPSLLDRDERVRPAVRARAQGEPSIYRQKG